MIRLTLPLPPSANRYWKVWRGRAVKSEEARAYETQVRLLAKTQTKCRALTGPVRVCIDVYRARRTGDLDNFLKVCIDSLKGIAFADDSQVVEIRATRADDAEHPRVFVTVAPVAELATVEAAP